MAYVVGNEQRSLDNKLWVDKYRPKQITELLGDATMQRNILHLFRYWKHCLRNVTEAEDSVSNWQASQHWNENRNTLVIWGPPGIGKTTAVPLLLQHMGFQVHYISAAEENSWESLLSRIEALRNKSCLFDTQSPPCIVLDDVVFTATQTHVDKCIKVLVDNAKRGFLSAESFKSVVLAVVICDDAYSRGLAPLRLLSHVVHFRESDTKSLIFRTMKILKNEQVNDPNVSKQETEFVKELCETAAGDIRWVLNQLQYIHNHFRTFSVSYQPMRDFKDLSRSNMIDIMKHVFSSKANDRKIHNGYFHGLSVAEYNSLFDICPAVALTAIETGDDMKQLTEIFDWQFAIESLSRLPSYETESVVKDVGEIIINKYTQLVRKVDFLKHFHEKRIEQQRLQNNLSSLRELRNSWIFSLSRFETTQLVAEVYPQLTRIIYHSVKNASNLTDMKQRIEAIQSIARICRCYGISIIWESKSLLKGKEMEIDSFERSWNFIPPLSDLSYFEPVSLLQTESQSFMETLSILIGILENPVIHLEHSTSQKESHVSFNLESTTTTAIKDDKKATGISFRFHEGHSNAILKPVTIDMLAC